MTPLKIALCGDVVGKVGVRVLRQYLPPLLEAEGIHFVVANGENLAGGAGTTPDTARVLFAAGVDVLTNGDHVFRRREAFLALQHDPRVIRPANLPPQAAGRGATVLKSRLGPAVGVLNLLGRVFMQPADCPFRAANHWVEELRRQTPVVVVDFHAEATSEKMALGWYLAGRVSVVAGTHTHVPTADEQILDGGTAYVTDLGMVGAQQSVIGRVPEGVVHRFVTGMPTPFHLAEKGPRGRILLVTVDAETGRALAVETRLLGKPARTRVPQEGGST